MKKLHIASATILAASVVLFAGCSTLTSKVNNNTSVVDGNNVNTANTNTTVTTNTNENTNVVVNKNTNTEVSGEVDTSDWQTYTNDEYGFSFKYPPTYPLTENQNQIIQYIDEDYRYQIKIFVREDVITESMSTEEALLYEDGRAPLPLISGEQTSVNGLNAYRAFRQLKKGDALYPNSSNPEISTITSTAIEYNYLNGSDVIRAWFMIQGETYDDLVNISDAIANSIQIN